MKLSLWMARERLDDELMAARIEAAGASCSPHAVAKWRRGERIPRGRNMALLLEVTSGEVTPNDFIESLPASGAPAEKREVA